MLPQDPWMLWADVIFGAVGAAAFIYGWKQRSWRPMGIGFCLSGMPYLISNVVFIYVVGCALCMALYFWRE
ncbi:MAG: hypothetical protein V2A70_03065 [Candidatus Omnitrophota bacterium]